MKGDFIHDSDERNSFFQFVMFVKFGWPPNKTEFFELKSFLDGYERRAHDMLSIETRDGQSKQ